MKILVTFAVDAEFAPWRKLRGFSQVEPASVPAYTAQIAAAEVIILLTGIGGRRAWADATNIIWDGNVDVCISSGLAGGLRDEHRAGDILAAREVHATAWKKVIPCDSALLKTASSCGAKIAGAFYSVDRVIGRSEEKRELGAKADAVEMESGEILLEAVAFGAKVIAIRGVSDVVEEDLPVDFNRVTTEEGDVSITRILMQAAAHPRSVFRLIRFGRQSHKAANKLALFLDEFIQTVARSGAPKRLQEVSAT